MTNSYPATQDDVERIQHAEAKRLEAIPLLPGWLIQVDDNIDLVKVNKRERNGKKNFEMHNYNRFITEARVSPPAALSTSTISLTAADFPPKAYFHTKEDLSSLRKYYLALLYDILVDHLPFFHTTFTKGALEPAVQFQEQVKGKTCHFQLPMLFYSESKYSDLKCILQVDLVSGGKDFKMMTDISI